MVKIEELFDCVRGKHIYIQTHNFPDPDAIASAYGLQQLLKMGDMESTICYKGKIDRTTTQKLVTKLGIEVVNVEHIQDDEIVDKIILVDAQKGNANISNLSGVDVLCIDHHKTYNKVNYCFCDIREDVGACSSIIASYYFENKVEMSKNVATALMYGIKVDTVNMSRGVSKLDLDVFYKLYSMCDMEFIRNLDMSKLQLDDLDAYANAISTIKVFDNVSFADSGEDCPEALIATVSDFMLSLEKVNVSIVYSVKQEGIKISVRTERCYDAGLITKLALCHIGSGGGHELFAGGFVPNAKEIKPKNMIITIEKRFIDTIHSLYGVKCSQVYN